MKMFVIIFVLFYTTASAGVRPVFYASFDQTGKHPASTPINLIWAANTPDGFDAATSSGGYRVYDGLSGPSPFDGRFAETQAGQDIIGNFHQNAGINLHQTGAHYFQWRVRFGTILPNVDSVETLTIGDGIAIYMSVQWKPNGKWALTDRGTVKASSTGTIPTGQWIWIQAYTRGLSVGNLNWVCINGETLSDTVGFTSGYSNMGTGFGFLGQLPNNNTGVGGWGAATIDWDQIIVYDTLEAILDKPDSNLRVGFLEAYRDSIRQNFLGGAGSTTNLFEALNNTPPASIPGSETDTSNIKNLTASDTDKVMFYIQSLTSYGVTSNQQIVAMRMTARSGEHSATGVETLAVRMIKNPIDTGEVRDIAGNNQGAHGQDGSVGQTSNKWWVSWGANVYMPTVDKDSATIVYVKRKTASNSNQFCLNQLGVNFLYRTSPVTMQGEIIDGDLSQLDRRQYEKINNTLSISISR